MSRVVAVIQARMSSTRLPGKVLIELAGKSALGWITRAASAIPGVDEVVVATSHDPSDDAIVAWCEANGSGFVRGPLDDVLKRYVLAAEQARADVVIRLTADCPFLDPWVSGQALLLQQSTGCDYATNADCGTWPDGLDTEVIAIDALRVADAEAVRPAEREHVGPFINARRARFDIRSMPCPVPGLGHHRWTLDTRSDLDYLQLIAAHLPAEHAPSMMEVLQVLKDNPSITRVETPVRNEGYSGLLPKGNTSISAFEQSHAIYKRALETIPIASQTFSKSALQLPRGRAPLFITHGSKGHVWDPDGNEYVDMLCALYSVSIGYCDPVVNDAIRHQLSQGISFSLASRLESELAEQIVATLPCAEAVRFGKNGSDATSAAIRVARAYTSRDRVVACGYHGWQDWYIGATSRNKGVPGAVRDLTDMVPYNDLPALAALFDRHDGQIAAVIMEPVNFEEPASGYFDGLKKLVRKNGALLIFDEIITGYRLSLGGAQELLGVTPDMACIGKGLGNGMPLGAVTGRKELMREMEDIFFSGTFGGETLSLAAGIAVIELMQREPVIKTLWDHGSALATGIRAIIEKEGLGDAMKLKGWSPWTLLAIEDARGQRKDAIRTLFLREMIANGVFTLGSNCICYRHTKGDIEHILAAYSQALGIVAAELDTGALEQRLGHPVIEPIFQVRKTS